VTGRKSATIPLPMELPVCEICETAGPCDCQALIDAEHQAARELHDAAGVGGPCGCWHQVVIHEGHCCFRDDPTPLDEISAWQAPICGHWPDFIQRPEVTG
jgi:hypothetical protein